MKRGMQNDFSFDGVNRAMEEHFMPMLESEITEEQLAAARELQQRYEAIRIENIAAYERDGLMPFERQVRSQLRREAAVPLVEQVDE